MTVRTRVAPSPTGFPHIGTIYQAMVDKAFSVKNNGQFIVRIEDTDQTRFVDGAEDALYDAFDWFGLSPDEGPKLGGIFSPYKQSERLEIYKGYANELVKNGHAYYCFCSKERLEEVRKEQEKSGVAPMYDKHCRNLSEQEVKSKLHSNETFVIRMKIPTNEKIVVEDLTRGEIEFDSNTVDDQVLLKADGFPTYHLAVVVDDHLMEITHVVRGPEWISSFPKHKLLYEYFGWKMPQFLHTPLISNMNGSKLSKRQGHASVDWYRRKGFLPEAVLNFIALLGWSHPDQKEIFTFEEYTSVFDLKDLSALSPKFDLNKLEWMNGQYIQSLPNEKLFSEIVKWLEYTINNSYKGAGEYITEWDKSSQEKLLSFVNSLDGISRELWISIIKERIKKFEDLFALNRFFFDEVSVEKELNADILKYALGELEKSDWSLVNLKNIESSFVQYSKDQGIKVGDFFGNIRLAVCRNSITPPLFESMFILGKEKTLSNLRAAL
ncbi:MAG: glutamyl-tRNA synthetase [Patescibacteria group bacterium]|nr:glutamyl-tRNA synthetase [Patescibacteria group bacterium]